MHQIKEVLRLKNERKRLINPNYRAGSLTATVGRYET